MKEILIFVAIIVAFTVSFVCFAIGYGEADYAPYRCERSPTHLMKYTGLHYIHQLGCLAGQRIEE